MLMRIKEAEEVHRLLDDLLSSLRFNVNLDFGGSKGQLLSEPVETF